MNKAVIYVRVSSKEQKEEGYSIPAQRELLREYAKEKGIEVVREYEEVETAKRSGRKELNKMIRFLKAHKEVEHILVEKTDRLTRNFEDAITIGKLGRLIHFVKERNIHGERTRAADKFVQNIKIANAEFGSDLISEETSKGMLQKAKSNQWPSYAPLGYVNNLVTKEIEVDESRASIIKELFEIYEKGDVSIRGLARVAYDKGLRTRKGNKVVQSAIQKMLKNPIYIGDFVWKGMYFEGRHKPIIKRWLFERVNRVMERRRGAGGSSREFAFRGFLRCGVCGCLITAEIKKEKYIYYRCTGGRGKCGNKPIREERLAGILGELRGGKGAV